MQTAVGRRLGSPGHAAVLERDLELSYGQGSTGNLIVQGGNEEVLDALASTLLGQVRCIYIDPPYNNQEQYTHYRDKLRHETWLDQVLACVRRLAPLLRQDGSIWISIDDSECHYLKVALDRIFGRENFVSTVIWEQRTTRENRKVFSPNHEYLLVYAKDARQFKRTRHRLPGTPELQARYRNPDNDPRGPWQSISANVQAGHGTRSQFYELEAPNGRRHLPPNGRCWIYDAIRMSEEIQKQNVWFGSGGNGAPRLKRFLSEAVLELTPHTLWSAREVGTSDSAKKQILRLFEGAPVFDTPKPEELVHRILQISTDPEDLVLDCFLGSGTTAAVAHKMGRRWVGVESGSHAATLCAERMRRVVDGEQTGVSRRIGWDGGGGFDFCRVVSLTASEPRLGRNGREHRRVRTTAPGRPRQRRLQGQVTLL